MSGETWTRTNDFTTTRYYTEGKSLWDWYRKRLEGAGLCLLEKGELVIICHQDDVQEIEKDLGCDRDIYAEKVDHVYKWLMKHRTECLDRDVALGIAKDLIAQGFEAGFEPGPVVAQRKPPNPVVLRAIDIVEGMRHLMNEQQLAQLTALKAMRG